MSCPTAATARSDGARRAGAWTRAAAVGHARRSWVRATWLVLALVLAQTAGFVHQSAHVPRHHDETPPAGVTAIHAGSSVEALVRLLVGEHGDDAQCLLFDQMSHGDLAPTASQAHLPAARPGDASPAYVAPAPSRTRMAARARGPPIAS